MKALLTSCAVVCAAAVCGWAAAPAPEGTVTEERARTVRVETRAQVEALDSDSKKTRQWRLSRYTQLQEAIAHLEAERMADEELTKAVQVAETRAVLLEARKELVDAKSLVLIALKHLDPKKGEPFEFEPDTAGHIDRAIEQIDERLRNLPNLIKEVEDSKPANGAPYERKTPYKGN